LKEVLKFSLDRPDPAEISGVPIPGVPSQYGIPLGPKIPPTGPHLGNVANPRVLEAILPFRENEEIFENKGHVAKVLKVSKRSILKSGLEVLSRHPAHLFPRKAPGVREAIVFHDIGTSAPNLTLNTDITHSKPKIHRMKSM